MGKSFFAPGKLLLSGEYSVLQGATAIAVPTQKGQSLKVSKSANQSHWKALDHHSNTWLDFDIEEAQSDQELLVKRVLEDAAPSLLKEDWFFEAKLDFPREWGLGSSSTFISLIARWAGVDVWDLFFKYLKGSGYDVAVAELGKNLKYWLNESKEPNWEIVHLPNCFEDTLLVYLGQKQNSAQEVVRFEKIGLNRHQIENISGLSEDLLYIEDSKSLQDWMNMHEALTGELIQRPTLKAQLFPKLEGSIKSLGAWGGDFAWYAGPMDKSYFEELGYPQVFHFYEIVQRF